MLAVFAACVVECVEALTMVLAVGISRNRRSTLHGVAAGLRVLTVVVAALGPAKARPLKMFLASWQRCPVRWPRAKLTTIRSSVAQWPTSTW